MLQVVAYVNTMPVGDIHIRNITGGDGVRDDGTADYRVDFFTLDDGKRKSGVIKNFPRSQGFWKLIETAMPYAPERIHG